MGAQSTRMMSELLEASDSHDKSNNFEETSLRDNRTLPAHLDPRSPSTDIPRTPIQVEETPKVIHDPRSPSVGIDRTPIFGNIKNTDVAQAECSSMKKAGKVPVSQPIFDESQDTMLLEKSLSESESAAAGEEAQLLKNPKGKHSSKDDTKSPRSKLFSSHTNMTESPQKSGKKDQSRSPLKVLSEGGSPRSNRQKDINSPRNIVQRKQMTKVSILKNQSSNRVGRSPVKYRAFDDKENMDS